ncbi:hypothetical protein RQP46_009903 [Phenoliferia psychrophenolica]
MPLSEAQLASLKKASHDVLAEATDFLAALIKVDTTNPPGLNYRKIAVLIEDHLKSLSYDTQLLAVDAVVDGIMYGRGVSDMKGGISAGVWAVECVKRAGLVLQGTVEQSGCVDEESTGVKNAGHRGAIWGEITFHGRASHGATPQRGINALVHAATFVVRAMETIQKELVGLEDARVIPEEARGPSLTFSVLQSGANTNSVPDLATLRFDRRLVPSESLEVARAQIQGVLDAVCKEIPEIEYTVKETYYTEPIWVDEELEVCKIWTGAVQTALGVKAGIVCSPGSDDQRFFVRGGIAQTIVYGPGDIKNVHNKDEALSLEDLRKSIEVMAIGICEFLGVD